MEWYEVQGCWAGGELEKQVLESLLSKFDPESIEDHRKFSFSERDFYSVDYVVSDSVAIEAKGTVWSQSSITKAEKFLDTFDYYYVVVGQSEDTKEIPCHKWFSSDNLPGFIAFVDCLVNDMESVMDGSWEDQIQPIGTTPLGDFNIDTD